MRTKTPPRIRYNKAGEEVGRTMTVQRYCNGCGHEIGDATLEEIEAAINGAPLSDVRDECPWCAPLLAETGI